MSNQQPTYAIQPIGTVHRPAEGFYLQLDEPFRSGLK